MERRTFLRTGCAACLGVMGTGLFLEGCSTAMPLVKATPAGQLISVPVNKFTPTADKVLVRSAALENDILLVRKQDTYKALLMRCTHEGIGVSATDKHIVCAAHGSLFDFDGHVLKEPALLPLKEYRTETREGNIIIHLT